MDWAVGEDILVIPNKINLLPDIAEEAVDMSLTQIVGTLQPIRAQNPNIQLRGATVGGGIEGVEEGGAVVPLQVVEEVIGQLLLYDVEVTAVGPVVPQIDYLQLSAVIHQQN